MSTNNTTKASSRPLAAFLYMHGLPPTSEECNLILARFRKRLPGVDEKIADNRLVQEFFGFSDEGYEKAVTMLWGDPKSEFYTARNDLPAICGTCEIAQDGFGLEFRIPAPDGWNEDCDVVTVFRDDIDDMIRECTLPKRDESALHPIIFRKVVEEIMEGYTEFGYGDYDGYHFVLSSGYPIWFDLVSLDRDEMLEIFEKIAVVCAGPFKELLAMGGYSQAEFGRRFLISKRTIDDWCSGANTCKLYLRLMFAELMGVLKRRT